jgi:putative hydrolase of the HAD superfamily
MVRCAQLGLDLRPLKRYAHLFFDLDHTLWDFQTNSRAVLRDLFLELGLGQRGLPDADALIGTYEEINEGLWKRMESGVLDKEVMRVLRFRNTLLRFGVKDETLARTLGEEYLERTPRMDGLFPGTLQLLRELRPHYGMHIITNGFELTQATKIKSSGLDGLFDHVITSERAGAGKPDPRIFAKALKLAKADPGQSLMIGDSITADMIGARAAGMDQAHFAPEGDTDPEATYRIRRIEDLRQCLGAE